MYANFNRIVCANELKQHNSINDIDNEIYNRNIMNVNNCRIAENIEQDNILLFNQYIYNKCELKPDPLQFSNENLGYDCVNDNVIYHEPDRKNTFHNYLVHDINDTKLCTRNHQFYNNWTKSKYGKFNNIENKIPDNMHITDKIPLVTPKICNIPYPEEYQC
jgi:hypothetical protein